jgi:PAS domain S-box-containing protein
MLLGCLPAPGAEEPPPAAGERTVLTSVAQVLSLSPQEADAGQPVRLRGVVTLYQPDWYLFFVQDPTSGIYLFDNLKHPGLRTGQWVEVEGVAGKTGRSPVLLYPRVRLLSPDEFAAPRLSPQPVSRDGILAGKRDAQWVELTGTVRQASWEHQRVKLKFGPNEPAVIALIPQPLEPANLTALFRAQVSVRAVCQEEDDEKGQVKAITLYAASAEDFRIMTPPDRGPFEVPLLSIGDCFNRAGLTNKDPWVRVKGTVIGVFGDTCFYLDDGERGIEVRPSAGTDVRAGDELEAAGFAVRKQRSASLEDAVLRKLGTGLPVEALALRPLQARRQHAEARLVSLEARLLEHRQQKECELLIVAALGTTLTAELRTTNRVGPLAALKPDCVLRLTGIWLRPPADAPDATYRLLLRSAADARVLHWPAWWTPKRILVVVDGLAGAILLVSGWAILLKLQVRRKTEQIRQRLEKEAELEQRFRDLVENANDMICTFDRDGRFTSLNRAGERILGYSRQELAARSLGELVVPDSLPNLKQILAASEERGEARVLELKVVARGGSQRILEADSRPFGAAGVQAIARDVTERKRAEAELAALQSQLLEISRTAGMAEVATAMLHNVANVLNSVNVSASLVSQRLKRSRLDQLALIAGWMREHAEDLGDFLTHDPKGRQVPGYLSLLAEHLAQEQSTVLGELDSLRKNVEHIKGIVATQQSYAKAGGVVEAVNAAHVLEDALRINAAALEGHRVRVIRQYDAGLLPEIHVDKHKVLQILINLLRNAIHACDETGRPDKCVTLNVANGEGRIKMSVLDNGAGIPAENLTRIFSYGFTTRKDGHGFGLHSGALAAREMGGHLRVESDGLGKGATFTLELPTQNHLPHNFGSSVSTGMAVLT